MFLGFPGGSAGKESACNAGDLGSIPGLGRFPWRTERLPTPVFWLGEFHGQSMGSQRVRHDWATFTFTNLSAMSLIHRPWESVRGWVENVFPLCYKAHDAR